MKIGKTLYITNRKEWRTWLREHYRNEKEIWLIYYKKETGKPRIEYNDAVEEALHQVKRLLLAGHLDSCVTTALRGTDRVERERAGRDGGDGVHERRHVEEERHRGLRIDLSRRRGECRQDRNRQFQHHAAADHVQQVKAGEHEVVHVEIVRGRRETRRDLGAGIGAGGRAISRDSFLHLVAEVAEQALDRPGGRVAERAAVWIADSPENRPAIESVWTARRTRGATRCATASARWRCSRKEHRHEDRGRTGLLEPAAGVAGAPHLQREKSGLLGRTLPDSPR
mgnify:CR=1 FL=1